MCCYAREEEGEKGEEGGRVHGGGKGSRPATFQSLYLRGRLLYFGVTDCLLVFCDYEISRKTPKIERASDI